MLKYYCMLIYILTTAHLGILLWILWCHEHKFIYFFPIFRICDKLKYEVGSRKLTDNACIYTVFMTGVRNK
jgi:hypothetical protein